jgi:hypothetical protein
MVRIMRMAGKENYKLRLEDFIPWKGVQSYGERNGYFDGDKVGASMGNAPDRVFNRMLLLGAYTGLHSAAGIYLTLTCFEMMSG